MGRDKPSAGASKEKGKSKDKGGGGADLHAQPSAAGKHDVAVWEGKIWCGRARAWEKCDSGRPRRHPSALTPARPPPFPSRSDLCGEICDAGKNPLLVSARGTGGGSSYRSKGLLAAPRPARARSRACPLVPAPARTRSHPPFVWPTCPPCPLLSRAGSGLYLRARRCRVRRRRGIGAAAGPRSLSCFSLVLVSPLLPIFPPPSSPRRRASLASRLSAHRIPADCPPQMSYHLPCMESWFKKMRLETDRKAGFVCPRGFSKKSTYAKKCSGMICSSHPVPLRNEAKKAQRIKMVESGVLPVGARPNARFADALGLRGLVHSPQ